MVSFRTFSEKLKVVEKFDVSEVQQTYSTAYPASPTMSPATSFRTPMSPGISFRPTMSPGISFRPVASQSYSFPSSKPESGIAEPPILRFNLCVLFWFRPPHWLNQGQHRYTCSTTWNRPSSCSPSREVSIEPVESFGVGLH